MDRRHFERLLTNSISRRRLLGAGLAMSTLAVSLRNRSTFAADSRTAHRLVRPQFTTNPFTFGVASGDPLADGVVLWTRLAPDPLNGGGMEPAPVKVRWEIANDDEFHDVVQTGSELAMPELGHSVHVDVSGLESGRDYFYRFLAGDEMSPTGRTRTAPAGDEPLDRLRFATVSCAHYEHGYFSAYRHLADEELDFTVCLGDYIYEYGKSNDYAESQPAARHFPTNAAITLADYRNRYALYKTDPDLQAAHLSAPWIVTWDDHEVENDYAGVSSSIGESPEAFLERRVAAYQAYYEHMPLRPESMPAGPDARIYRRLRFGDLAELNLLDTRQHRSDQACGGGIVTPCDAGLDPARTLLGDEQETWLFDGLANASSRWNVIGQQVMMAQLDGDIDREAQLFSQDQWDGYPVARQRLLEHVAASGASNPVVLTGDVHSAWVSALKLDFNDEASRAVATELVTTSVTSLNPFGSRLAFLLPSNPHFSYFDARHGYAVHELTPDLWRADFRAVATVETPDEPIETIASFVIEDGAPGAVRD